MDDLSEPPVLPVLTGSRPEREPVVKANDHPDKRLQVAYDALVNGQQRISGRALARLAHVNRETANRWLGKINEQQEASEPEAMAEVSDEAEAMVQGEKERSTEQP